MKVRGYSETDLLTFSANRTAAGSVQDLVLRETSIEGLSKRLYRKYKKMTE